MNEAIVEVSLIYSDDSENSKEFVYGECIGEIVRCKDCKWWRKNDRYCQYDVGYARSWNADSYCSYGERKN